MSLWIVVLAFQLLENAFLSAGISAEPTSPAVADPAGPILPGPILEGPMEKTKSISIDGMPFVVPAIVF